MCVSIQCPLLFGRISACCKDKLTQRIKDSNVSLSRFCVGSCPGNITKALVFILEVQIGWLCYIWTEPGSLFPHVSCLYAQVSWRAAGSSSIHKWDIYLLSARRQISIFPKMSEYSVNSWLFCEVMVSAIIIMFSKWGHILLTSDFCVCSYPHRGACFPPVYPVQQSKVNVSWTLCMTNLIYLSPISPNTYP